MGDSTYPETYICFTVSLNGVSLYKIQQWLRHSDPRTTMIYAHMQAQDD